MFIAKIQKEEKENLFAIPTVARLRSHAPSHGLLLGLLTMSHLFSVYTRLIQKVRVTTFKINLGPTPSDSSNLLSIFINNLK